MPLPRTGDSNYVATRANWLGRYLDVERGMDQQLYNSLVDAAKGIDETMAALAKKKTKTAATRRLQMALAQKEIRAQLTDLYGNKVLNLLKTSHSTAAEAAVEAALHDEKRLLSKIFKTPRDQEEYAKSLRQTARRNIESVMTRVLETQQPLSKRVYKTRAISQGMVDRAINRGMARGDSYTDIAKSVHHLIDPATPGGVSYAAKRLARTETNNAFHAQSIHDAQESPWTRQMRWNLSKVHSSDPGDPCEDYARQGLFQVESVPHKPHPHCRCFVTPEPVDDDTFDHALLSGQYDDYLDDFISGGQTSAPFKASPAPVDMTPSPVETATTKATQPTGWTGPLVAKAAANASVRKVTDDMWTKYHTQPKFLQVAREGSRTVQVKGYKGGLSSPGKQALLGQADTLIVDEPMAFDIGREITARLAHETPSAESVFHAKQLSSTQLANLRKNPGVSMPLSTFERTPNKALTWTEPDERTETVVFEVVSGAKVTAVGDSRVTMGHFSVESMTEKTDPGGNKYHAVRLKQLDPREFDADTPRGQRIPDIEFVSDASVPGKPVAGPTTKPVAVPKTKIPEPPKAKPTEKLIAEADSVSKVLEELSLAHPDIEWNGWTSANMDVKSAKEIGTYIDKMLVKYPTDTLTAIEISTEVGTKAYAHVQYYPWAYGGHAEGTSVMRFNPKYTRNYAKVVESKKTGRLTRWNTLKEGAGAETPWGGTTVHEYGHVLDNATKNHTRGQISTALKKLHKKLNPFALPSEFKKWLKGPEDHVYIDGLRYARHAGAAPSGYSVHKPGRVGFDDAEIIAESLADVEFNGDKASDTAKEVVKILMREYKNA